MLITSNRLVNTTKRLKMTALVTEEARAQYARAKLKYYGMTAALASSSVLIGGGLLAAGLEGPVMLALTALPLGGAITTGLMAQSRIANTKVCIVMEVGVSDGMIERDFG